MPESPLVHREATAVSTLEQLAADRARAETGTEKAYLARKDAAERGFEASVEKVTAAWQAETGATQARYKGVRDETVARFRAELGPNMKVIATGGLASLIANETKVIDHIAPWLTLEGLKIVWELNHP